MANVLNYNKCKYNLTRTAKKKILSASDARGEKAAMPKKGGVRCALEFCPSSLLFPQMWS